MGLPQGRPAGHATERFEDVQRLIDALHAHHAPRRVLEHAKSELSFLWKIWHSWEFGTDQHGNSHDPQEAQAGVQDLAHEAATLEQRLARVWRDLAGRA